MVDGPGNNRAVPLGSQEEVVGRLRRSGRASRYRGVERRPLQGTSEAGGSGRAGEYETGSAPRRIVARPVAAAWRARKPLPPRTGPLRCGRRGTTVRDHRRRRAVRRLSCRATVDPHQKFPRLPHLTPSTPALLNPSPFTWSGARSISIGTPRPRTLAWGTNDRRRWWPTDTLPAARCARLMPAHFARCDRVRVIFWTRIDES